MPPWMAEQLAESRTVERERAAARHRRPVGSGVGIDGEPTTPRPRPPEARAVGGLFIALGRRLAGPDALSAALEGSRAGGRRSAV